jgi:hypothetical protein
MPDVCVFCGAANARTYTNTSFVSGEEFTTIACPKCRMEQVAERERVQDLMLAVQVEDAKAYGRAWGAVVFWTLTVAVSSYFG